MGKDSKTLPPPDVQLDESTLQTFKKVVEGFPEAQRKQFSDSFNAIDDPSYKVQIIHDVLNDHSQRSKPSVGSYLKNAGDNLNQFSNSFLNTASGGGADMADALAKKIVPLSPEAEAQAKNMLDPEPKGTTGQAYKMAGNVAGLLAGPARLGSAVTKEVLPATTQAPGLLGFGARRVADAAGGSVMGAAMPGSVQERDRNALIGAGANAALGTAGEAVKPIKELFKSFPKATGEQAAFAEKVREGMYAKRGEVGQALDDAITDLSQANPGRTVDLRDPFNQMLEAVTDPQNPGLRSDITRTIRKIKDPETVDLFQRLLANPEDAANLTLRQSEDMKRAIQQGVKFGERTPGDRVMADWLADVKLNQANQFQELSGLRGPYAKFMDSYRNVKNMFKPNALTENIQKGFGNQEIENMVKDVLPENIIKEIGGVKNAVKLMGDMKDFLKGAGIAATAAEAGAYIAKKSSGN